MGLQFLLLKTKVSLLMAYCCHATKPLHENGTCVEELLIGRSACITSETAKE